MDRGNQELRWLGSDMHLSKVHKRIHLLSTTACTVALKHHRKERRGRIHNGALSMRSSSSSPRPSCSDSSASLQDRSLADISAGAPPAAGNGVFPHIFPEEGKPCRPIWHRQRSHSAGGRTDQGGPGIRGKLKKNRVSLTRERAASHGTWLPVVIRKASAERQEDRKDRLH